MSIKQRWLSLPPRLRTGISVTAKLAVTVGAFYALFTHKIPVEEGRSIAIYEAILEYVPKVDPERFWLFCALAGGIKLIGVVFSAWSWHLLLKGQRIEFPFWRQIMTTFLIGRFIGTFLPSTIGLDAYTLYDAGRYSRQWERATMAKALEKFIGITGLFLGMLILLPFGIGIFGDHALVVGGLITAVAGSVVLGVFLSVFRPGIIQAVLRVPFPLRGRVEKQVARLTEAAGAYRSKPGLLLWVFFSKFMVHFTTAVVYVFTAMAVGVEDVDFGRVTFASTIQILGTIFSPTIAGEGAREAIQAYLLQNEMGVVQSLLSASLGFIAAEAATMWGGVFWWFRRKGYRPAFCHVDGAQVEYKEEEEAPAEAPLLEREAEPA